MLVPQDIIDLASSDPLEAAVQACRNCTGFINMYEGTTEWNESEHALLLETFAFISALADAERIRVNIGSPDVAADMRSTCTELLDIIIRTEAELAGQASLNKLATLKSHFASAIGTKFVYVFTEGDLSRVQTLLNELRNLVADADDIHGEHKQRLLKRLEQLQSELHKKTSDLSRFYGLLGEAGVVIGKFGEDAKPIVDRVREILQITWRTQATAEELPSGTTPPLLEKGNE